MVRAPSFSFYFLPCHSHFTSSLVMAPSTILSSSPHCLSSHLLTLREPDQCPTASAKIGRNADKGIAVRVDVGSKFTPGSGRFMPMKSERCISRQSPYHANHNRRWYVKFARASSSERMDGENVQKSWDAVKDAIFELEFMVREPADVLEDMQERLSTRDLQVMLVYFSQDGRDSWCALEVFEWMQNANKVEDGTHELMMSIMFQWVMKLVEQGRPVEEVRSLMRDMSCVGLTPEPGIVQEIISTYCDKGEEETAIDFVKGILETDEIAREEANNAVAFLILKVANSKEERQGIKVVSRFRDCGFRLSLDVYKAALLAAVSEQEQLTRMMRLLAVYQKKGEVGELEEREKAAIEEYEAGLHQEAEQIARWAMDEEVSESVAFLHEKLLAMYCIAGRGLEAEHQLWQMKLAGREVTAETYNTVVGICAYRNHVEAARRIMETMKAVGRTPNKRTYSVLLGGFLKGGHVKEAAKVLQEMLDKCLTPDNYEMMVVLKEVQKTGQFALYIELCQALSQVGLIGPFLIYLYIDYLKLCIVKML